MPYKDLNKGREHHAKYMREVWYPQNKVKHIGYIHNLKKKIYDYISTYKKNNQCLDCGFSGSIFPEVLEFDHLTDKKFEVSTFFKYTTNLDRVKNEIAKCELICANCHRIRTAKRRKENMSG